MKKSTWLFFRVAAVFQADELILHVVKPWTKDKSSLCAVASVTFLEEQ